MLIHIYIYYTIYIYYIQDPSRSFISFSICSSLTTLNLQVHDKEGAPGTSAMRELEPSWHKGYNRMDYDNTMEPPKIQGRTLW